MVHSLIQFLKNARRVKAEEGWLALSRKGYDYHIRGAFNRRIKPLFPHEIGVQGEYTTGNVGDYAIGMSIQNELRRRGHRAWLFDQSITESNARVKILGGGGVIHDWYGVEALRRRMAFISDNGLVIGVGVPGLRSEEGIQLVANTLPKTNLITVRDDRSKQILQEICDVKIHRTADPAFLLNAPNEPTDDLTGLNFRPWFKIDPFLENLDHLERVLSYYFDYSDSIDLDAATKSYIDNMRQLSRNVQNPVFIPFHPKDESFAREYLDIDVLPFTRSVDETLRRIDRVSKMITMRYHSLIFAAICEKPVIAIDYDPKVLSLAKRLDISAYKPHREIPVEFESPQNIRKMKNDSKRNFDLIEPHLQDTSS